MGCAVSQYAESDDNPARSPLPVTGEALNHAMDALDAAYAAINLPDMHGMPPDEAMQAEFRDRGSAQWAYGEVPFEGMGDLFATLGVGKAATFLDVGSGTGRVVLYAATALEVEAVGIELVPARHDVAIRALDALSHGTSKPVSASLRCGDVLSESELGTVSRATHIFCNNAVWSDALTSEILSHLAQHAPNLASLAVLRRPSSMAVFKGSGLRLASKTCVDVTWDAIGWPLFTYKRPPATDKPVRWPVVQRGFAGIEGKEPQDGSDCARRLRACGLCTNSVQSTTLSV